VTAKGKSSVSSKSSSSSNKGDTVEIIRSYLYAMHQVGVFEVEEKEILLKTGYARTDSHGYRNAMKQLTKEMDHVRKNKGKLGLTDQGLEFVQAHGVKIKVAPVSMEEHQKQLLETLEAHIKAPADKINAFWQVLSDGQAHPVQELLQATGYARPDSNGYKQINKWFKTLELIENNGTMRQFTDKVYRFGARPN